jgi:dolichol kinase
VADAVMMVDAPAIGRRRTADRVFLGSLLYTAALTLFWLFVVVSGRDAGVLFSRYKLDAQAIVGLLFGFLFFGVFWGLIWYGVKNLLLRSLVGFSKDERRAAFSSRMDAPYDVQALLARYSERRIRIADMIGRRGRFITLQLAFFYFLYSRIATEKTPAFLTLALQDGLFDAVVLSWVGISLYYSSGILARLFWGAQTRVMDGTLGRANCLLITTLWSAFKFVMVPIGIQLSALFPPDTYATLFVMIWGSYVAADASAEIVGSLIGKQKLRVWGMGDVNRKSIAGTLAAFLASLALCLSFVLVHHLGTPWVVLAVVIAVSNTFFELFSPRGTDDFTMATANALVCWAFGLLIY